MPIEYYALTKGLLKHGELDIAGGFPVMVSYRVQLLWNWFLAAFSRLHQLSAPESL